MATEQLDKHSFQLQRLEQNNSSNYRLSWNMRSYLDRANITNPTLSNYHPFLLAIANLASLLV